MTPIRRILFATDFSDASRPASERAVALAKDSGAELVVVHVYEPPVRPAVDAFLVPRVYDEFEAEIRSQADQGLAPIIARAADAGVAVRPLVLRGVADEAIARAAKDEAADLVVVGTHGRGGVARLLLGSVAARVVSSAPCPVLTVPAA